MPNNINYCSFVLFNSSIFLFGGKEEFSENSPKDPPYFFEFNIKLKQWSSVKFTGNPPVINDILSNQWKEIKTFGKIPKQIEYRKGFVFENYFYIMGGMHMEDLICRLNLMNHEWEFLKMESNEPSFSFGVGVVLYENTIYVIGGENPSDTIYMCPLKKEDLKNAIWKLRKNFMDILIKFVEE